MTLAARCPACLTVFRVAPEQLRLADGWLRCGRCGALFDTTAAAPPAVAAADATDAAAAEDPGPIGLQRPSRDGASSLAAPPTDDGASHAAPADPALPAPDPPQAPPAAEASDELPPFARPDAAADARWRRPGAMRALAIAAVPIAAALAIAFALQQRDLLAARWPTMRPALEALCRAAGCRVEPLRRIGDLAIESSTLTAAPTGSGLLLGVVVRNRGELPLALPWVALVLTEVNGRPLARRTLSPAELGATSATIAAAGETALQTTLVLDGAPPSGYTVEIFYP